MERKQKPRLDISFEPGLLLFVLVGLFPLPIGDQGGQGTNYLLEKCKSGVDVAASTPDLL